MDLLDEIGGYVGPKYVHLPSIIDCREQYDPYRELAQAWDSPSELYQTDLVMYHDGTVIEDLSISVIVPKQIALPDVIPLFWDVDTTYIARFSSLREIHPTSQQVTLMREITALFFQAPSSRVGTSEQDYVVLFIPSVPHEQLEDWALEFRVLEPRLFRKWVTTKGDQDTMLQVECQSIPRRQNFLQPRVIPVNEDGEPEDPRVIKAKKIHLVPVSGCSLANLPSSKAMVGLLISAILDRMAAVMVADELTRTVLSDVDMQDLNHILTATATPLAQASTHYQLYEFFGDSVLKFSVSCHLFFRQPNWQEGHLSIHRDKIVNNRRLAHSALENEIDRFIWNDRFTPRKWDPPMISKRLAMKPAKRSLSLKVLADVIEALIGAAYLEGGIRKAQACLHRLLPEIDIEFHSRTDRGEVANFVDTTRLAPLLGYNFKDASLLTEALTHPSCESDQVTQSYQRLEFSGDAVLDMVVVSVLSAHPLPLNQGKMTMIKHSLVNANLLAFLCMELSAPDKQSSSGRAHIWEHLRFAKHALEESLSSCLSRYAIMRDEILDALESSPTYPWELLARLRADKFFSDIVESVIGAIFLDSGLDACAAFLEKIGLIRYLRRILDEDVIVQHPRNAAQDLVKLQGVLVFKPKRVEIKGIPATYRSSAVLDQLVLASIEGCGSAEEADIRVAHLVIAQKIPSALAALSLDD
ncbi:Dicer-like protein 2 [Penicillium chermesinum]|nr:Dicer-like protein 2 [Penicillium chermesinum]